MFKISLFRVYLVQRILQRVFVAQMKIVPSNILVCTMMFLNVEQNNIEPETYCFCYATAKLKPFCITHYFCFKFTQILLQMLYAAVNGHLELPLLKDRQRFDAISTSNLEVYKFRDWWILTYFILGHGESSPNNIWSMVNLERTCVYCFIIFFVWKWILT